VSEIILKVDTHEGKKDLVNEIDRRSRAFDV